MKEEAQAPEGEAAPTTSEDQVTSEILHKVAETYQEVATVLANKNVVINKYT